MPTTDLARSAASVAIQSPDVERPAPATLAVNQPPGTVTLQPGPFDDRVRIRGARLSGDRVTASLDVVSDVSELIALEIRVDFYDTSGTLIGTGRQQDDAKDSERYHGTGGVRGLPVTVRSPGRGASSAVLSIPVLVNE